MIYTIDKIVAVLKQKGYIVFEEDTKNFNLNLVGIRKATNVPNSFDDLMNVFWKYNGQWTIRTFPCTTDPGTYWLQHSDNPMGTGILKEGQYKGCWRIGKHQGKYTALVQNAHITCIRDFNKDSVLDFTQPNLTLLTKKELKDVNKTVEWYDKSGKLVWREQTGMFGMNGHRANENGGSVAVDKWSAMCMVLQNRQINNPDNQLVRVFEFDYFMNLCQRKIDNMNGLDFTYTLINEKDFV